MMRHDPAIELLLGVCRDTRPGKMPTERKAQTPPHRACDIIERRTSSMQVRSDTPRTQETSHDAI